MSKPLILGVDGGGTKTAVAIAEYLGEGSFQILAESVGRPSNVRTLGKDRAFENVHATIAKTFAAIGLQITPVASACLSLAGAGRAQEQAWVRQWAEEKGIASLVSAHSDAEILLAAADWQCPVKEATDKTAEIAVIAGTGSIVWGRSGQNTVRGGGWGYLLGDAGSAFAIGRDLLHLLCRASDGRDAWHQPYDAFLEDLQLADPTQLIQWCYDSENPRSRIASVAPWAFRLAESTEEARRIVDSNASELAEEILSVHRRLPTEAKSVRLVMAGSVLTNQKEYRERVVEVLRTKYQQDYQQITVGKPVYGALRLAGQLLEDQADVEKQSIQQ